MEITSTILLSTGLLLIFSFVCCFASTVESPPASSCGINLEPESLVNILVDEFYWVTVNSSCALNEKDRRELQYALQSKITGETMTTEFPTPLEGTFMVRIVSLNRHIAAPSEISFRRHHDHPTPCKQKDRAMCSALDLIIPLNTPGFYVEANQVGRARLRITLAWWNNTLGELQKLKAPSQPHHELDESTLDASVVRKPRIFYKAFDYSAVFIACMTAVTVGCCTETARVKRYIHSPKAIVASLVCQHILMPVITIGTTLLIGLPTELAYGLFATSTLPGGGLAHLIVFLMDGDRPLSTAISLLNTLLNLCISPIWLVSMGWYFDINIQVHLYILWLLPGILAHILGVTLRYFKAAAADALMTWFTRPILLLSGILLITLGVYINHYAFHYIDYSLVSALLLTIFGAFCIGGLAGVLTGSEKPVYKALAAETSVFNCLLLIPAVRHGLDQPEADLAATVPLWGIFFTPTPILLYFVAHKVKATTLNFIQRRKEKQYRHYSIVSSLAKMAQDVGAVSAQVAKEDENVSQQTGFPIVGIEKQEKTTSL